MFGIQTTQVRIEQKLEPSNVRSECFSYVEPETGSHFKSCQVEPAGGHPFPSPYFPFESSAPFCGMITPLVLTEQYRF